eukprot:scaffold76625_cov57-Phaeocystis_antarctica.AAC.1
MKAAAPNKRPGSPAPALARPLALRLVSGGRLAFLLGCIHVEHELVAVGEGLKVPMGLGFGLGLEDRVR